MFSHVMVGARSIDESKAFYDAVLGTLGVAPGFVDDQGRVFYITDTGIFAITIPIDGNPASAANGGTIGFAVPDPETGDAWHAAGLANGGEACEDPPGIRESAMGKMYLAYMRDPAGNKICALKRL